MSNYIEGKRYDQRVRAYIDDPEDINRFLDAYEDLCREHGMCFAHEDSQGGFIIENFDASAIEWARDAMIGNSYTTEKK